MNKIINDIPSFHITRQVYNLFTELKKISNTFILKKRKLDLKGRNFLEKVTRFAVE